MNPYLLPAFFLIFSLTFFQQSISQRFNTSWLCFSTLCSCFCYFKELSFATSDKCLNSCQSPLITLGLDPLVLLLTVLLHSSLLSIVNYKPCYQQTCQRRRLHNFVWFDKQKLRGILYKFPTKLQRLTAMNILKVPFDSKLQSKGKAIQLADCNAVFQKVQDLLADMQCRLRPACNQLLAPHHTIQNIQLDNVVSRWNSDCAATLERKAVVLDLTIHY